MNKIIITGIIGLITSGSLIYDATVLTETEIQDLREQITFTQNEDFIFTNVAQDQEVEVDLSQISIEEVTQIYIDVLKKLDDDFKGNEMNLAKRIKTQSKKKTFLK